MLPVSPAGRRYGYRPAPPDSRDFKLNIRFATLPPFVDLEPWCGPVKDQGALGACTAFAGSGNREYLARRYGGSTPVLSPLFLYYQERLIDSTLEEGDTGSTGRTSCMAMNRFGICPENADTYDIAGYQRAPTAEQLAAAYYWKSGAYHRLFTSYDIKTCLVSGYPAMVGFTVYSSFEDAPLANTGFMPVPAKNRERVLGGHEVLFIGYDDRKAAFKVRNSWGAGWGAGGNFWFPYEAANDPDVLIDSWMQHMGKPWSQVNSQTTQP